MVVALEGAFECSYIIPRSQIQQSVAHRTHGIPNGTAKSENDDVEMFQVLFPFLVSDCTCTGLSGSLSHCRNGEKKVMEVEEKKISYHLT